MTATAFIAGLAVAFVVAVAGFVWLMKDWGP